MYDVLANADCLCIMTEWSEFRNPDFDRIGASLREKVIFDGRNLYGLDQMKEKGFYYNSIGRTRVKGKKNAGLVAG
jgi:UDPglucose 6-dehydrogenase